MGGIAVELRTAAFSTGDGRFDDDDVTPKFTTMTEMSSLARRLVTRACIPFSKRCARGGDR
jgi:hypothetical protein